MGLSGGLDSLVAAYLLRIQKKELFGLMIAATPEDLQDEGDKLFACHANDARIAAVKKFCEHLHIPLSIVRPRDEFVDEVLEPWAAARLEVRRPRQCQDCHGMRMRFLYQKALELGCESFATGHYAKLFKGAEGQVSVHSSNDPELDQSGLILGLPQEILRKLELPLSELQHKEVLKIAENFQLNLTPRERKFGDCLTQSPRAHKWITTHTPESLRIKGEVLDVASDDRMGHYDDQTTFEYGRPYKIEERGQESREWDLCGIDTKIRELKVAPPEWFNDTGAVLLNCRWDEGTDLSLPLRGYLHLGGGLNDKEIMVYPKSLNSAYVELLEGQEKFVRGTDLVIFKRRGKNAKVIVSGQIGVSGRHWKENVVLQESKEGGGTVKEINKDFNF